MHIFKAVLVGAVAFLLTSCASDPQVVTKIQIEQVPVTVYCKVTPVPKPDMPFDSQATPSSTLYRKVQLLASQDAALKGYSHELEGAIAGCAAPTVGQ